MTPTELHGNLSSAQLKATQLKEALTAVEQPWLANEAWEVAILDAARERLAQLEADPELVERIAGTIWKHDPQRLTGFAPDYLAIARTVLAALITTDEEAE